MVHRQRPTPPTPWWQKLFPWLFFGSCAVFVVSMVPNFLGEIDPALNPLNEPSPEAPVVQQIPLWRSSFEAGFPSLEWPGSPENNFSAAGTPLENVASQWTILNADELPGPSSLSRPTVPDGDRLFKAWINRPHSDGIPHASYPRLDLKKNPEYFKHLDKPIVLRFYVWVDGAGTATKPDEWLNLVHIQGNSSGQAIALGMRGPLNQLELIGVGTRDGFQDRQGWEVIAPTDNIFLPLRQWVAFTLYLDYPGQYLVVWMDNVPILRANGGVLRVVTNSNGFDYVNTINWGLEAAASLKTGLVYNDNLQVWAVSQTQSLEDLRLPDSPYEKSRREEWMDLPPDAPPEVRELWEKSAPTPPPLPPR